MTAVKLFKIRRGERTFRRLDEGDAIRLTDTLDDRIIIGFSGIFAGDVTIGGNLTVNGNTTTINSTTHDINDNVIVLNDGETGAGVVTLGIISGFEVDRGSADNVRWVWYEPADLFRPEFAAGGATHVGMVLDPTVGTHVGDRDYNDARYLLETNNLSDLVSDVTSRQNLGVEIGVDVQAWSAILDATTASFLIADETKLDGIEVLATADQTAAEILAALITVDGTTSGLDADLLDGLDSTAFLQNIVEDLTPQLGGNLNASTFGIGFGGSQLVLAFASGGEAAVNNIELVHAVTGLGPIVRSVGSDTNVDLNIETKGTGAVVLDGLSWPIVDGTNGQVLTTNGVGNLSFADGGGTLDNIVEDTTPQLGGQLDINGNAFGDGVNPLLGFVEDVSSVNWLVIENEATGSGPILRSVGADTNVDLNFESKGTGEIIVNNPVVLQTYTVAAAPTATAGAIAFFSNGAAGSPVLAYADGANWLRCDTRAVIASS